MTGASQILNNLQFLFTNILWNSSNDIVDESFSKKILFYFWEAIKINAHRPVLSTSYVDTE